MPVQIETLKKFEFPVNGRSGFTSKYDWDLLLDGKIHTVSGVEGKPEGFKTSVRMQAESHRMHVKIHHDKETNVYTLQATKMSDEEVAETDAKVQLRKENEKARIAKKKAEAASKPTEQVA